MDDSPRVGDVPECLACGACCFSLLPTYVRVTGDDYERLGERAPDLVAFEGNRAYMRMHDGHCAALGGDPQRGQWICTVYEDRPGTCRDLGRGSPACAGERAEKGDRPKRAMATLHDKSPTIREPEPMPLSPKYSAAPRITELGAGFYDAVSPARFPKHILRYRNPRWSDAIGLGALDERTWEAHFARFEPLPGNLSEPLALRYHGHQFDTYNPNIGDGRGFLFAQVDHEGRLLDLATKGSGRTPWSRDGDGRLTLKGGVREVLATSMLEALGVSTSKSFSLFETGESLWRGDEPSPTRSSVLVRLGHSHIRFGTFQRLAYEEDKTRLDRLLSYSIAHYFPDLALGPDRVSRFLARVTRRTASLAATFMVSGFVHGVLNSDNMVITGEGFDYGPYRFLPRYDPEFVAAYFDHQGLYAYGRQPGAILRNLMRLAQALRPIEPHLALAPALADFEAILEEEAARHVLFRLGLRSQRDTDTALVGAVYAFLEESRVGYDRFFFDLYGGPSGAVRALASEAKSHYAGAAWDALRAIIERYEPTFATLPTYFEESGPCTLLIEDGEAVWSAIADRDDWGPLDAKLEAIRAMGAALGTFTSP